MSKARPRNSKAGYPLSHRVERFSAERGAPRDLTPEQLLAKLRRGDEHALEQLYDRFAPRLLGVAIRILADREAAERTVEATFLELCRASREIERQAVNVAVWLVVRARALAIEQARNRRRLPPLACGNCLVLSNALSWLPRPPESARIEARRQLLAKLLAQLPASQRGIVDMAFTGGLTELEIAEQRREPLARVRTELHAATTFLKHRLRAVLGTWSANI